MSDRMPTREERDAKIAASIETARTLRRYIVTVEETTTVEKTLMVYAKDEDDAEDRARVSNAEFDYAHVNLLGSRPVTSKGDQVELIDVFSAGHVTAAEADSIGRDTSDMDAPF